MVGQHLYRLRRGHIVCLTIGAHAPRFVDLDKFLPKGDRRWSAFNFIFCHPFLFLLKKAVSCFKGRSKGGLHRDRRTNLAVSEKINVKTLREKPFTATRKTLPTMPFSYSRTA